MAWKSASNGNGRRLSKPIRGQISNPILLPNPPDEALSTEEQAVTRANVVDSRGNDKVLGPQTSSGSSLDQTVVNHQTHDAPGSVDSAMVTHTPNVTPSTPVQAPGSPNASTDSSTHSRQSISVADVDAQNDKRASTTKPQLKKSVFRSALSKLFGRKKRGQSRGAARLSDPKTMLPASNNAPKKEHRSDPTYMRPNHVQANPNRSFSMPITDHHLALGSHSIKDEDVLLVQNVRNSLSAEKRLSGKYLPSFSYPTYPACTGWNDGSKLAGLSPRPASSQDRRSRGMTGLNHDSREIGRAISSDCHGLKRRSRSVSEIPKLGPPSSSAEEEVRRHSAEIRFWRESYAAPFASQTSAKTDDELVQLQNSSLDDMASIDAERPVTPEPAVAAAQTSDEGGKFASPSRSAYTLETLGPVALENRVDNLETRMSRLEGIVLQIGNGIQALRLQSNNENRQSGPRPVQGRRDEHAARSVLLQPCDMELEGGPRRSTIRPDTRLSDASNMSLGETNDTTPRATILPLIDVPTQPDGTDEITSDSPAAIPSEQYTSLLGLLETERLARVALEAQVRSLSRQMQFVNKSLAYTNTDHSEAPSLDRSFGEVSTFDHEEEDDSSRRLTATAYHYDTLALDDSGVITDNRSDNEYTESFVTPAETSDNVFSGYEDENDTITVEQARKMSLFTFGHASAIPDKATASCRRTGCIDALGV